MLTPSANADQRQVEAGNGRPTRHHRIADGEPVPAPSIEPSPPSVPGALIGFVEVDIQTPSASNRATRLSVTIPEHALALIDFAAKRAGTSRSEFLTRSALTCIEQDARRNA
ncbi:MAG: type II toxin-antitoxin system HicB family antitoxin [Acidobacteria bacterium]|nr:type II toxin-antitoxin system HicB family antitoxin [Acidobacteriota bacterium]